MCSKRVNDTIILFPIRKTLTRHPRIFQPETIKTLTKPTLFMENTNVSQIIYPRDPILTHTFTDSDVEVSATFPSVIVFKSIEEKPITKLCPFAIERFHSSKVASRSIKTVHNNTLMVGVTKEKYADLLLKTTTLYNMKIKNMLT